jgi:hypothetical protein
MAKRKHKIDFTGVESFNKPAEGKHKAKIKKVEETTSAGGNDMFKVTFEVVSGESKGCRVIDNYPLVDTALWKLKSLLQAIGMKADGRVQVDLDKMENKVLEIKVFYEDYNGQERAKIGETNKFISKSEDNDFEDDDAEDDAEIEDDEDDEDDEEIEEEKPSKKKKSKVTNTKKQNKKENEKKEESDDDVDDDEDIDDWDDDDWDD